MDVVPAEHYVKQLWEALGNTEEHSACGVGSHLPVGSGGTLDPKALKVCGAEAPKDIQEEESTSHAS